MATTSAESKKLATLRDALRSLGPEPDSSSALVQNLGLRPLPHSNNLVAPKGVPTPLAEQLSEYVHALHRVAEAELAGGTTAGMYLAYLTEWQVRSTDRERYRRKIAKALIEHQQQDRRWIVVLLDERGVSREAEFVLPRAKEGKGVSTVRASVDLDEPNRYHAELLNELTVHPGMTLLELSTRWNDAFSVERVTKRFYEEFGALRDRLIDDLLEHNPDNPMLKGRDRKKDREFDLQLHAFGTRQLGRMLFLWFLQQKRWLGSNPGAGDPDFLTQLFHENGGTDDSYYSSALVPLFFDGLGLPLTDPKHKEVVERLGPVPFLGGGLFRAGADEFEAGLFGLSGDELERTVEVVLPDALFDPAEDKPEHEAGKGKAQRTVLGLFRGYRFTTQESTPDDQSVDPDPELLGKVFENLYQADERHKTGAYYTPREIVHYMCRQTLDGYLRERTGISQVDIDWLREEALDWTVSDLRLDTALVGKLEAALHEVTILDPAVGSGAFLLAAIHEIVLLRRGIVQSEQDRDVDPGSLGVADWKRHLATNCVYGVDINPMAVEICQLRLLLSLVVELDVSDFRDVPALPNLDFRIVAGDSLVDRMGEEPFFESLPRPPEDTFDMFLHGKVKELQKKVDDWSQKFAGEGVNGSDGKRLRDLRSKIRGAQVEIARIQLDHVMEAAQGKLASLQKPGRKVTKKALMQASDQLDGLKRLELGLREDAPYQKPFLWFVNFHEVFRNGGFDIVLANPPYVRMEAIDNIDEKAYGAAFREVARSRADLLVYFYARALQLLREGGQLAFITSNKFMRATYGEGLRKLLPQLLQVEQILDFGDLPLFSVAAYPVVLTGRRVNDSAKRESALVADLVYPMRQQLVDNSLSVNTDNVRLVLRDLQEVLREVAIDDYPHDFLGSTGWILEEPRLVTLFHRLMEHGTPLKEYVDGRIYWGIKTGLNDAFVVDQDTHDELVHEDAISKEILEPWIRGRDVKRGALDWAGLHLIFAKRGTDIKKYPAIKKHLTQFRERLEARATAHTHPWWELQQPQEGCYEEFALPKIVWPRIAPPWECRFAFDESSALVNDKCYVIAAVDQQLCMYLNSPLCLWLADKLTTKLRGGYLELKSEEVVGRLPVPDQLPSVGSKDDKAIHSAVCESFALSEEDSAEIWRWYEKRQVYRTDKSGDKDDNDD